MRSRESPGNTGVRLDSLLFVGCLQGCGGPVRRVLVIRFSFMCVDGGCGCGCGVGDCRRRTGNGLLASGGVVYGGHVGVMGNVLR